MVKDKLILDIRYFESEEPNVDGMSPHNTGRVFKLPVSINAIGARVARKLRELEFTSGSFDHVYVNFTTALPEGTISSPNRSVHPETAWLRYVDFGANALQVNSFSTDRMERWVYAATFDVVRFLAGTDTRQLAIVEQVRELLATHGEDLEIVHKTKETKTYAVTVSYRIAPHGEPSTAWLGYTDKKSGVSRRGCFAKLEFYEDILFLVSAISVVSGKIVLRPRNSYKATLYNERYTVPISIEIDDLPIA